MAGREPGAGLPAPVPPGGSAPRASQPMLLVARPTSQHPPLSGSGSFPHQLSLRSEHRDTESLRPGSPLAGKKSPRAAGFAPEQPSKRQRLQEPRAPPTAWAEQAPRHRERHSVPPRRDPTPGREPPFSRPSAIGPNPFEELADPRPQAGLPAEEAAMGPGAAEAALGMPLAPFRMQAMKPAGPWTDAVPTRVGNKVSDTFRVYSNAFVEGRAVSFAPNQQSHIADVAQEEDSPPEPVTMQPSSSYNALQAPTHEAALPWASTSVMPSANVASDDPLLSQQPTTTAATMSSARSSRTALQRSWHSQLESAGPSGLPDPSRMTGRQSEVGAEMLPMQPSARQMRSFSQWWAANQEGLPSGLLGPQNSSTIGIPSRSSFPVPMHAGEQRELFQRMMEASGLPLAQPPEGYGPVRASTGPSVFIRSGGHRPYFDPEEQYRRPPEGPFAPQHRERMPGAPPRVFVRGQGEPPMLQGGPHKRDDAPMPAREAELRWYGEYGEAPMGQYWSGPMRYGSAELGAGSSGRTMYPLQELDPRRGELSYGSHSEVTGLPPLPPPHYPHHQSLMPTVRGGNGSTTIRLSSIRSAPPSTRELRDPAAAPEGFGLEPQPGGGSDDHMAAETLIALTGMGGEPTHLPADTASGQVRRGLPGRGRPAPGRTPPARRTPAHRREAAVHPILGIVVPSARRTSVHPGGQQQPQQQQQQPQPPHQQNQQETQQQQQQQQQGHGQQQQHQPSAPASPPHRPEQHPDSSHSTSSPDPPSSHQPSSTPRHASSTEPARLGWPSHGPPAPLQPSIDREAPPGARPLHERFLVRTRDPASPWDARPVYQQRWQQQQQPQQQRPPQHMVAQDGGQAQGAAGLGAWGHSSEAMVLDAPAEGPFDPPMGAPSSPETVSDAA